MLSLYILSLMHRMDFSHVIVNSSYTVLWSIVYFSNKEIEYNFLVKIYAILVVVAIGIDGVDHALARAVDHHETEEVGVAAEDGTDPVVIVIIVDNLGQI